MPPSSSPSSSPAALLRSPSSRPVLCVVRHDEIVSEGPGLAKAKTFDGADVQFSERVRNVMSALGLTIPEAAERWGYSIATVKNWRAGRAEPRWSEWAAIERDAASRLAKTGTQ